MIWRKASRWAILAGLLVGGACSSEGEGIVCPNSSVALFSVVNPAGQPVTDFRVGIEPFGDVFSLEFACPEDVVGEFATGCSSRDGDFTIGFVRSTVELSSLFLVVESDQGRFEGPWPEGTVVQEIPYTNGCELPPRVVTVGTVHLSE